MTKSIIRLTLIAFATSTAFSVMPANAASFAKYDGIEGESSASESASGATGQSRRRGDVIVEDISPTMEKPGTQQNVQAKPNKEKGLLLPAIQNAR